MIRNKLGGILTCCDRCAKVLATNHDHRDIPLWEYVVTPMKGKQGQTRRYDFCDEKCRIIYFRGNKYWQRKLNHMEFWTVYEPSKWV